jgi:uncharacterized protein
VPASDSLLTDEYCPTKACAASAENLIGAFCKKADGFVQAVRQRDGTEAKKATMNREFRHSIGMLASNNDLYEMVRRPRKFHYCATGRRMYAIDYNGEAYPCHRFVGNKKYALGQIGQRLDADLWRKSILLESPECSRCFCRYSCGGGCAYDGVSTTGDLFMPNPVFCSNYRETLKYSIYIMSQMTREDLVWLESEKIITLPKCVLDF